MTRTYNIIGKIAISQEDDYSTGSLIMHISKKTFKVVAIDLSKQQAPNGDPKAMQQINFTWILESGGNTAVFFITEEIK